jgi:colanic acid/amylovoran biosynthesis glycosyltransferase
MPSPSASPAVAYLVNQYPKGSHTFVRREILALEALGMRVLRFTVRQTREAISDPQDVIEAKTTRAILAVGAVGLLTAICKALLHRPLALIRSALLAVRLGRRSERGIFYHLIYLAEACVLGAWLREQSVRHVHAHFGTNSTVVAMLCASLWGVSYSFTIHGPEEFDKAPLLSLGEKVARARFVAVISSFGRSQLYRHCDSQHWDKIVIVPCGLDESFLNEVPRPVPPDGGLVCVGRLSEQKGHIILCKAAASLAEENAPFHVTFIGDGELRLQIETFIQKHKLENNITLAGWKDGEGVKAALRNARALVLPSFAEGLPVVLMESLALGRPVITTFIAGIPELVQEGVNGWLVPASDVEALAKAIQTVMKTSTDALFDMGNQGRARVHARHDIRDSARLLGALFAAQEATASQVAKIFRGHLETSGTKQ